MVDTPFDVGVILIGLLVTLFSVLGLQASKREQLGLLQLYACLLSMCACALVVLGGFLFVSGLESIEGWVDNFGGQGGRHSHSLQNLRALVQMLQAHRLMLSATMVLLLFLVTMNISMVCSLRWLLTGGVEASVFPYDGIVERIDTASEVADSWADDPLALEEEDDEEP